MPIARRVSVAASCHRIIKPIATASGRRPSVPRVSTTEGCHDCLRRPSALRPSRLGSRPLASPAGPLRPPVGFAIPLTNQRRRAAAPNRTAASRRPSLRSPVARRRIFRRISAASELTSRSVECSRSADDASLAHSPTFLRRSQNPYRFAADLSLDRR